MNGIKFTLKPKPFDLFVKENDTFNSLRRDGRFFYEHREIFIEFSFEDKFLLLKYKVGLTEFLLKIFYAHNENQELKIIYKSEESEIFNTKFMKELPDNSNKRGKYLEKTVTSILNFVATHYQINIEIEKDDGNILSSIINAIMLGFCLTGNQISDYLIASEVAIKEEEFLTDPIRNEEVGSNFFTVWEKNFDRNLAVISEGKILKKDFKKILERSKTEALRYFDEIQRNLMEFIDNFKHENANI